MKIRVRTIALLGVVAMLVLAACGDDEDTPTGVPATAPTATVAPTATADTSKPTSGGVLIVGIQVEPPTFDAHIAISVQHINVQAKLMNSLLTITEPLGEVVCELCESYRTLDGGKAYEFTLKRGVKFQDGTQLTARDVKYSYEKAMGLIDGVVSARAGLMKNYMSTNVEVLDTYRVRLNLPKPAAALFRILASDQNPIYKEGTTKDELVTEPVGVTGPYELTDWVRGSSMTFEPFKDYFKTGLPRVDQLEMLFILDDTAREAAFLAQRLDWVDLNGFSKDRRPRFLELQQNGEINFGPYLFIMIGVIMNVTQPPLDDARVRRAIFLAVDRDAINVVAMNGDSQPRGFLPTGGGAFSRPLDELRQMPGYRKDKEKDLAEARQLLADAGYSGGLEIPYTARNQGFWIRMGESVVADMAKIGITSKMTVLDDAAFFAALGDGKYSFSGWAMVPAVGDPDELWFGVITGRPENWAKYSSAELDELFEKQSAEADTAKRLELNKQLEDIVFRDAPWAPAVSYVGVRPYWDWFKGWHQSTVGSSQGLRMEEVWDARSGR